MPTVLTLVELPEVVAVLRVAPSGISVWCRTFRIDVRLKDGEIKSYFMKVSLPLSGLILWLLLICELSVHLASLANA